MSSRSSAAATHDPPCNCGTLRKAARRMSQLYDGMLEPCGIKLSQYQVLSHIEKAGGAPSMGELAASLVLDRSALARNLKPLEREGYVEQIRDETDGRSRLASLTPAGKKKLAESQRVWRLAQERFDRVYGEERSRVLAAALAELFSDEFQERFTSAEMRK